MIKFIKNLLFIYQDNKKLRLENSKMLDEIILRDWEIHFLKEHIKNS
jgi:hypothetical protein